MKKKIGGSVLKKSPKPIKAYRGELLPPSVRKTIVDFVKELKKHRITYMVVGAVPVQFYGRERFSRDVDFAVRILTEKKAKMLYDILEKKRYAIYYPDKIEASDDLLNVYLVKVRNLETNSLMDIILKPERLGLEVEAYKRAKQRIIDGEKIRIPSAEDYLISKLVSRRDSTPDYVDIISTLINQFDKLDWSYLVKQAEKYNVRHLLNYYKEAVARWK